MTLGFICQVSFFAESTTKTSRLSLNIESNHNNGLAVFGQEHIVTNLKFTSNHNWATEFDSMAKLLQI